MALNPMAHKATGGTTAQAKYQSSWATYQKQREEERKRKEEQDKRNAEAQKRNTSVIGEVKGFFTGGRSDIPLEQGHFPILEAEAQGIRPRSDNIADYDTQQIYDTIAEQEDEETQDALFADYYDNYASNPASRNYNPYVHGISNDRESREMFGVSSFDRQWIEDNAYLAQELNLADGAKPSKPTKKSTPAYRAGYQWWTILQAEDTTQRAEAEEQALRERVQAAYTIDPEASAEDVLGAIDWETQYPTLFSMREAKDNYSQITLNRGVECSDDYVRTLCDAAKSGRKVYDEDDPEAGNDNWYLVMAQDRADKIKAAKNAQEASYARTHGGAQTAETHTVPEQNEELEQADDLGGMPDIPMAHGADAVSSMAKNGAIVEDKHAAQEQTAQLAGEAIDPNYINGDLNDIDLAQTQEMERAQTVRQQAAAELAKPFGERSFDVQMVQAAADVPDAATGNMDIGVLAQAQQMEAEGDEEGAKALLDQEARATVNPVQGAIADYSATFEEFSDDPDAQKVVYDAINRAFNAYDPNGKTQMYNRNNAITPHDMFAAFSEDDAVMVYKLTKSKEAAVMQMIGEASIQEIGEVEDMFDAAIDDYCHNVAMGAKDASREKMTAQVTEWSARHPFLMGAGSIALNAGAEFLSTAMLIPTVAETVVEGKLDTNSPQFGINALVQAEREGSTANLNGGWKFVVNTLYSAADSLMRVGVANAVGGVSGLSTVLVSLLSGSGAATNEMRAVYDETGSAGAALAAGITNGVVEAATENIGVDNFTGKLFRTGGFSGMFKNWGEAWRMFGKSVSGEALEEYIGYAFNYVANWVITRATGEEYGYTKLYDDLLNQNIAYGMSVNDARDQAFSATYAQYASDSAMDALSGGIAGGLLGGGNIVAGARMTSAAKKSAYSAGMAAYNAMELNAGENVNIAKDALDVQEEETNAAKTAYDSAAAELENVRGQIARGEISFEDSVPVVAQATDRVGEAQKVLDAANNALNAARTKFLQAQAEMVKFNRAAMQKARESTRKYVDENWGGVLTDVRAAMDGKAPEETIRKYADTPFNAFVSATLTPFTTKDINNRTIAERERNPIDMPTEETEAVAEEETAVDTPVETAPVETVAETETPEPKKLTPYQFRNRALADIADIMAVDDETASIIEGTALLEEPATRQEANTQLQSVERAYVAAVQVLDQLDGQLEENAQMQQDLSASMANMDVGSEQYAQAEEMLSLLKERFNTLRAGAEALNVRHNAVLRWANELRAKFAQFDVIEQAAKLVNTQTETAQETEVQEAVEQTEAPVEEITDLEEMPEEDTAEVTETAEAPTENMSPVERADALLSKRFDHEVVNPQTIQVDAETFQFKTSDAETGTNAEDTLTGEWKNGLAGEMIVYETADGTQYIADGHHRLQLAKQNGVTEINATVLRETDGYTKQDARTYATLRNITQEHGSVHDMARFFRETGLSTEDAQRLGISMNKAKAGEAARIANVSDETWAAYERGDLSDHAVALAGTMPDKLHEDILVKVLSKKENKRMSNAVIDEIAAAVRMTQEADTDVQMTLGDFIDLSNYNFEQIGRIAAAVKKQLSEGTTALKRALGRTGRKIEAIAGNKIEKDATAAARQMAQQAQGLFARYEYDPELSALVSDQAKLLRDKKTTIDKAIDTVMQSVVERVAGANGNQNESPVLGGRQGVRAESVGESNPAGEGRDGSVLAERNGEQFVDGLRRVEGDREAQGEGRGSVDAFVRKADAILGRDGDDGSGNRGDLTSEPDSGASDTDTVKRTSASLKTLSRALGLTYTTHHIAGNVQRQYNGYGVMGYNERHSNVSAFPYLSKVGVWAHESGHALMNAAGLNKDADFMADLNDVWQYNIPDSFKSGYTGVDSDTQSREAFAEILRTYIEQGQNAARRLAGDNVMDTFLDRIGKKQRKALDRCAAEIQKYNGADFGARVQSKIVTGRQTDYHGAMNKAMSELFDSNYAFKLFDIAASERGADLKSVSKQAYTLRSNLSTSVARARAILTEGMWSADGEMKIADSLKDVLAPIRRKYMPEFKQYLYLKHDTDRKVVNVFKARPLLDIANKAYAAWQEAQRAVEAKEAALAATQLENGEAREHTELDDVSLEELKKRAAKLQAEADTALENYNNELKRVDYSIFPDFTLEEENAQIRQLEERHPEFAGTQKALMDWLDTFNREYIVNQNTTPDAAARYAAMREMYPNYVPAFRSGVDEVDVFANITNDNGGGGSLEAESAFGKKLKGNSDRAVTDPIENIQRIIIQRVVNTERVLANRRLAEIADETPNMGDYLRYLGDTQPQNMQDVLRVVDKNGNYRYYQVTDRLMLEELNYSPATVPVGLDKLVKVKAFMSGLYTTYNPAFVLSNMARDYQQAYASSVYRGDPARFTGEWMKAQGESFIAALTSLVGHEVSSDYYKEFVAAGGSEMQSLYRANTFSVANSKVKQALTLLADATESGTRYMEYKRARQAGETVQGAYRMASDITTDFSRHGTNKALQLMGKGFLFMNAGLQGLYETQRFYNDGKINKAQFAARMAKMLAVCAVLPIIARAAVAAAGEWDDGEDWEGAYENLSADVKRNFLVFPNPLHKKTSRAALSANMFIKIPKIRSLWATAGDIVGRALIDEDNIGQVALSGLRDANPFGSPVWASLYELTSNRAWTGKDIESSYWRGSDLPKRYWANENTSSVAKWLGGRAADMGIENISPLQIDYFINQTGGVIGDMLTAAQWREGANAREIVENTLGASWENLIYSIGSRLVTDPAVSTDVINAYYSLTNDVKSTSTELSKYKASAKYPTATKDRIKTVTDRISKTKKEISDIYDQIDAIDTSAAWQTKTPAERQLEKNRLKNLIIAKCIDETLWVEKQMDAMR